MDHEKEATLEAVRSIPSRSDANPQVWLQKCQKEISVLGTPLAGIMEEILFLLATTKSTKEINYETSTLIHNLEQAAKPPETYSEPAIELPKINIPTFDGDTINWVAFWEQFDLAIHSNNKFNDV